MLAHGCDQTLHDPYVRNWSTDSRDCRLWLSLLMMIILCRRQVRCVRDEDSATYRSCAFAGNFAAMALGTHSGEIRLHDTLSGDAIDTIEAHESPVYQLRVCCHIQLT